MISETPPKCPHLGPIDSLTLAGLGNIGTHLIAFLARIPGLRRVNIVDFDGYEKSNLAGQDIQPRDVGKPKARAQAARLRRLCPALDVRAFIARLEDVPLGLLRADVLLTGLDSRVARCRANEIFWRLGMQAWIDGGVQAAQMLARVNVYLRGAGQPCYECSLSSGDYAALEQQYACGKQGGSVAATAAPACLGGLTAALQAIELHKMVSGQWDRVAAGCEVMFDGRTGQSLVSRCRPPAACRFDHSTWAIKRLEQTANQLAVSDVLALGPAGRRGSGRAALAVAGRMLVRRLTCLSCGAQSPRPWAFHSRWSPAAQPCSRCGGRQAASATDTFDWLEEGMLPRSQVTLARLGVRAGDVLVLRRGGRQQYLEIPEETHHGG